MMIKKFLGVLVALGLVFSLGPVQAQTWETTPANYSTGKLSIRPHGATGCPAAACTRAGALAVATDATWCVCDGSAWVSTTAAAEEALADHLADTADAHDASAISLLDSAAQYVAENVEDALAEVLDALQAHEALATDAHDASAISVLDSLENFTGTDVETVLSELDTAADAISAALTAHIDDTADAHDASAISILDTANQIAAGDVEGALAEVLDALQADVQNLTDHEAETTGAHAASAVSFDDALSELGSITVQGALDALVSAMAEHTSATDNPHSVVASQVAVTDSGLLYVATEVEAALAEVMTAVNSVVSNLALATGATLVGFDSTGLTYAAGLTIQSAISGLDAGIVTALGAAQAAQGDIDSLETVLVSTANGDGASVIAIEDSAGQFTSENVEGALAESLDAAQAAQSDATLALARTPSVHHLLPLVVTPVSGSPSCTSPYRDSTTGAVVVRCTGGADNDSARVGACVWVAGDSSWNDGTGFNYVLSDGTGNNLVKVQVYDGDDTSTACYAADTGGAATSWTSRTLTAAALSGASCSVAGWTCVEALVTLDTADTVDIGLFTVAVQ